MKRRFGVSIIECIVSMAVISVIFSCTFLGIDIYKSMTQEVQLNDIAYQISDMLYYARRYSYVNREPCKIRLYKDDSNINKIELVEGLSLKSKVKIPECIRCKSDLDTIYIDNYLISGGTIKLYLKKKSVIITIEPTTNKINIRNL